MESKNPAFGEKGEYLPHALGTRLWGGITLPVGLNWRSGLLPASLPFNVSRGLFGPSFGWSGCAGGARWVRDTSWKLSAASTKWTETAEEGIFSMGVVNRLGRPGRGWVASVTKSTALWTVISPTQRVRTLAAVSSRCGEVFSMVGRDLRALCRNLTFTQWALSQCLRSYNRIQIYWKAVYENEANERRRHGR